jgi:F0F1-type ATP synthase assembly protein I
MTNENGRDKELDELLKPLKKTVPSELQMQKWKSLVKTEGAQANRYSVPRSQWLLQLVAAVFVGIVIGTFATKHSLSSGQQANSVVQISFSDDATYEHSHANLD